MTSPNPETPEPLDRHQQSEMRRRTLLSSLGVGAVAGMFLSRHMLATTFFTDPVPPLPEPSEMDILKNKGELKLSQAAETLRCAIETNPNHLQECRNRLLNDIWPDGNVLPTDLPADISTSADSDSDDWPMPELRTYRTTYKITVTDEHPNFPVPFTFHVYYYKPPANADSQRLMIVHQGHGGVCANLTDSIAMRLANSGFHILYANMPLIGGNFGPDAPLTHPVHTTPAGSPSSCGHEFMGAFTTPEINALRYYFSQIPTALHHAKTINESEFTDISMCGISGGGYTTTVYPALDTSIQNSFAIAGSMPHELRLPHESCFEDDPRQSMFRHAPMYTMYALASVGPQGGRIHRQMYNLDDGVFGAKDGRHNVYEPILQPVIRAAGGDFAVSADMYAHQHHITYTHRNTIANLLGLRDL